MSPTLQRWRLFMVLNALLLIFPFQTGHIGANETWRTYGSRFGTQLYLIAAPTNEIPALLPPTVVLHAQLHTELGGHYLTHFVASGGVNDLAAMERTGLAVRVLDANTAGKVYYFADAQVEKASLIALQYGEILYANTTVILIGVLAIYEQSMLGALLMQGTPVAALTADPLHLQRNDDQIVRQIAAAGLHEPDPSIVALLAELTTDNLAAHINELSGEAPVTIDDISVFLDTRYTLSTKIEDAERYLFQYYTNLGMNVSYHEWTFGNYQGRNVIVDIPGTVNPERIWLLGGHFDTISQASYSSAPGADDNGTGIAATMLIARYLRNYQFAETVRFVHFSGEEQGQWGSKGYAIALNQADAQIMGYIDLDMIGYDSDGDRKLELHTGMSAGSNALGEAFIENNDVYTQGLVIEQKTTSATRFSDHSPFWDNGYPAILVVEDFFDNVETNDRDRNPEYHRTGDKIALVDLDYVLRIARVSLATLATLAGVSPADPNATPTTAPTITNTPTATLTPTPLPGGCQELLINGNLETRNGWSFGSTPFPAGIVETMSHNGQHAIRLGIPADATNLATHSSAFQAITLPSQADQVSLRYWEWRAGASDGVDYQEILLLDANYDVMTRLERNYTITEPEQWIEHGFDLSAYRGQTIVIYFNIYNNGGGGQQWGYVDDVEVVSCAEEQPTSTPTFTSTPSPIATLAPGEVMGQVYLPYIQK